MESHSHTFAICYRQRCSMPRWAVSSGLFQVPVATIVRFPGLPLEGLGVSRVLPRLWAVLLALVVVSLLNSFGTAGV